MKTVASAIAALLLLAVAGVSAAADAWREYSWREAGIAAEFPAEPTSSRELKVSKKPFTEFKLQREFGGRVYLVSVQEFATGFEAPKIDASYIKELTDRLASGGFTPVRTDASAIIAGRLSYQIISRQSSGEAVMVYAVLTAGRRAYHITSGGPPGHEDSEETRRFFNSVRVLSR